MTSATAIASLHVPIRLSLLCRSEPIRPPHSDFSDSTATKYELHFFLKPTMPHSKTPGGQAASDKFKKQEASSMFPPPSPLSSPQHHRLLSQPFQPVANTRTAHGLGAENAAGHTEGKAPGEAPVASDSGISNVGVEQGTNQPGEKGDLGPVMDSIPVSSKDTRGVETK